MNQIALEHWASNQLRQPILLSWVDAVPRTATWTTHERAFCDALFSPARRLEWQRGRLALKALLRRLGLSDDTSDYTLPHPRLSLSHSGRWAVAAGSRSRAGGLGVDLECTAQLPEAAERFYLVVEELAQLMPLPAAVRARRRQRLWCIKEAVFKADLRNHGCGLRDYRLTFDSAAAGTAHKRDGGVFRFISRPLGAGFLALAIAQETCHVD